MSGSLTSTKGFFGFWMFQSGSFFSSLESGCWSIDPEGGSGLEVGFDSIDATPPFCFGFSACFFSSPAEGSCWLGLSGFLGSLSERSSGSFFAGNRKGKIFRKKDTRVTWPLQQESN